MSATAKGKNEGASTERKLARRGFVGAAWVAAVTAAFLTQAFYYLRAMVPNLLYEKPRRAKIGTPDRFADGTTYLEEENVFIRKEGRTFEAFSAACTHLGCTVKLVRLNQPKTIERDGKTVEVREEFHCPCHGSKFYGDGTNYAGPAPRPLDRLKLVRALEDGQLVVDLGGRASPDERLTV